jgi:hypothetical protein
MDLGKIMIGIALVMLSAGMLISPASAAASDHSCAVGGWSAFSPADGAVIPYSPQDRENPAGYLTSAGTDASPGGAP